MCSLNLCYLTVHKSISYCFRNSNAYFISSNVQKYIYWWYTHSPIYAALYTRVNKFISFLNVKPFISQRNRQTDFCKSYDNVLSVQYMYSTHDKICLLNRKKMCVCIANVNECRLGTDGAHIYAQLRIPLYTPACMYTKMNISRFLYVHRIHFDIHSKSSSIIFYILSSVAIAVRIHLA